MDKFLLKFTIEHPYECANTITELTLKVVLNEESVGSTLLEATCCNRAFMRRNSHFSLYVKSVEVVRELTNKYTRRYFKFCYSNVRGGGYLLQFWTFGPNAVLKMGFPELALENKSQEYLNEQMQQFMTRSYMVPNVFIPAGLVNTYADISITAKKNGIVKVSRNFQYLSDSLVKDIIQNLCKANPTLMPISVKRPWNSSRKSIIKFIGK